jgi:hypothetical protein
MHETGGHGGHGGSDHRRRKVMKNLTAAIICLLALASLLVVTGSADAATTIVSPVMSMGFSDNLACFVLNISRRPIDVQLQIFRHDGALMSEPKACTDLEPYETCRKEIPATYGVYCLATVVGTVKTLVRGSLCDVTTGACLELH